MSHPEMKTGQAELPALPLTLEGHAVLHQMFRFRWSQWRGTSERDAVLQEAVAALAPLEAAGESAVYSLLGHKGDLLFLHFRPTFDELNAAEVRLKHLRLESFLEPLGSYVSVIELGLYDSTVKLYRSLAEKGITPSSPEWNQEVEALLQRQREAMKPRLYPKVPGARYLSFYPMDRRRGETKNWYTLPIEERGRQMESHGLIGRRYAGKVQQIISGSIGFDDWEWGVDLFSDDPLIFKKLIYEMRFDEVSAVYSNFGQFVLGIRVPVAQLGAALDGNLPPASSR
jgi:peroxiredoxin